MFNQIKSAIARPNSPTAHGIIFAIGYACFFLLLAEFGFGIAHLVTLWTSQGGIIWYQALTWAIAVAPLLILFFLFSLLHSMQRGGQ